MMMGIWNLIDEKNLSLFSLYKNLCHENKIAKDVQIEIDNKFDAVSHTLKGNKILRHNIIVHISKNMNYDEAFDKANIKYDDIRDIIVELGNIYNLICFSIGENQVAFWVKARLDKPGELSENDVKRLLNDLLKFNKST